MRKFFAVISRTESVLDVARLLRLYPVVGLLGPRQVGKTTLAAQVGKAANLPVHWFDLEDHRDVDRLAAPLAALESLRGLIVLDEIQHRPEIFPALTSVAIVEIETVSIALTK